MKPLRKNEENSSIHSDLQKYLEFNLSKEVWGLYNNNYSALRKEIEEDIRK